MVIHPYIINKERKRVINISYYKTLFKRFYPNNTEACNDEMEDIRLTTFCCPESVPATKTDEDFCIPCDCPESIPQPKFPSPTSSLSRRELEELEACIEEANELLLAIALGDDVTDRALQLSLRPLREERVSVTACCHENNNKVNGILRDAGLDFIILEEKESLSIIPMERIVSIEKEECEQPLHEPKLLTIDPCLRRELTFHFSEVVSRSPYLLNIFIGISLPLLMESFVCCYAYVQKENSALEVYGRIVEVNDRSIILEEFGEKFAVDFDEICILNIVCTKN